VGWIVSKGAIDRSLWDAQWLAPYHRTEPLGFVIRTGASILLFLPRSNARFRERRGARLAMAAEAGSS
jgi:hypothetical protein